MTESAAITLHLADITGTRRPGARPRRARARGLPALAGVPGGQRLPDLHLRRRADPLRQGRGRAKAFRAESTPTNSACGLAVEAAAAAPWFLGARLSALDLYLAVMTNWRPRRAWFAAARPKLHAAALAAAAHPRLAACFARNFKPAA
jgi:GST-like protein